MSISYTTNFKPSLLNNFNKISLFKNNNKNKIVSKNFFLFLLLLKFNNDNVFNFNSKIFIKPFYKKFITLLRAPYRYKLARHQFILNRYFIILAINMNLKKLYLQNISDFFILFKLFKNMYVWFESNIVYQHQVRIFLNFYFSKNFLIYF